MAVDFMSLDNYHLELMRQNVSMIRQVNTSIIQSYKNNLKQDHSPYLSLIFQVYLKGANNFRPTIKTLKRVKMKAHSVVLINSHLKCQRILMSEIFMVLMII